MEPARRPSYDPEISKRMFLICLIIPATFIAALLFYREPFHLLRNAFSELGETVTPLGQSNRLSRLIFSTGWTICGLIMIDVSGRFHRNRSLKNRAVKRCLAVASGIGFFVGVTPNDVSHGAHSVGMGLIVGTMYLFGVIFLVELKASMTSTAFAVNMTFLQAAVLTYAATYMLNASIKQAAQKLCVFGLLLVMEKAVTAAPEGFEWRQVLQAIRK